MVGINFVAVRKALCKFLKDMSVQHSDDAIILLVSRNVDYYDCTCEALEAPDINGGAELAKC